MKKKKITKKLSLEKVTISNLNAVRGGSIIINTVRTTEMPMCTPQSFDCPSGFSCDGICVC